METTFRSEIERRGQIDFPAFAGLRVMMMPFRVDDPHGSIPSQMGQWREAIAAICAMAPEERRHGVGYVTIDEALVRAGETHRRPGLHVDGVGPDGRCGAWGGGGGWGANGMLVAASIEGCRGWRQDFTGRAGANGDCAPLAPQCRAETEIRFLPSEVYACGALAVHESIPLAAGGERQFVRVSLPSTAPWYEGYTRNPLGVEPAGPIHPARTSFMQFRA